MNDALNENNSITKENAGNIKFNLLKLQFKKSEFDFKENNFKTIYRINNLKDFWAVIQNIQLDELIQKGSIFLSLKTPIWIPSFGTFSFIVSKSTNNIDKVFTDICLFYIENLLNENKKIEGVSVSLKGREHNIFNIKVILNSQDENDINFSTLPTYFGNPKFSLNCQRQQQQQQQQPPPLNKNYYNNYHKKNKYNNNKSKKKNNNDD